jgi:hypothetical protein
VSARDDDRRHAARAFAGAVRVSTNSRVTVRTAGRASEKVMSFALQTMRVPPTGGPLMGLPITS